MRKRSLCEKEDNGLYRSAVLIRAVFSWTNSTNPTCYGFEQVVDADRALCGLGGFWIDTLIV
jgi:hypothetical protein